MISAESQIQEVKKLKNFLKESVLRKYCMINSKQIRLADKALLLKISLTIKDQKAIAMINSESTDNFMTKNFVKKKRYFTQRKKNSYDLIIVDENLLFNEDERVNTETISLSIATRQHHEKLIYNLMSMITHEVVLRMSWLRKHNSEINWKKEVFKINNCQYVIDMKSTHQQRRMMNENIAKQCELTTSNKNDHNDKFDLIDTVLSQTNQQIKVMNENYALIKSFESTVKNQKTSRIISVVYKFWEDLFREEINTSILSKHQS